MKIVRSKTNAVEDFKCVSVNETVSVNVSRHNGPEIDLEDGTRLVFSSPRQHFRVMNDPEINNDWNISIANLRKKYFKEVDDVSFKTYDMHNIVEVEAYYIMDLPMYRFVFAD